MSGYQPIDPIQMRIDKESDTLNGDKFLTAFPNEATRLAIGEISQLGTISFGPFSIGTAGKSYSVILDYIKYTTTNLPVEYLEDRDYKTLGDSSIIVINQRLRTNFGQVDARTNQYLGKSSSIPSDAAQTKNNIKIQYM